MTPNAKRNSPDAPDGTQSSMLSGLDPLGLMEGVLGGQSTDWEPPSARELESCFPGYTGFQYIDRGGMGAVYAATQVSLERRVAVKILPPDMGADTVFVDSFHREARMLAMLQHPHIVAIYDFGCNAAGHLFIVMEYVDGYSLLDVSRKARPSVPVALEIICQTCEALQFAHDRGVVHRDIKPSNILIDERGKVRVADFGLAKTALQESGSTTAKTQGAFLAGTPAYAAPEQRRATNSMDHRADIFSLGVTFYEMLTGYLPVGVFEPPSRKVGSPPALDKIISKALRESPEDRYQKAEEMRKEIRKVADRLAKPIIQHAISERPIVSMMTTVIVTSGLIFMFGEINTILERSASAAASRRITFPEGIVSLDDTFSLLVDRVSWDIARERIQADPYLELASLHSAEEIASVCRLLTERGIRQPVWTGGWQTDASASFEWTDGTPFDFEDWMPHAVSPPVVITEIQAKNQKTLTSADGTTPDWIELYNPGTQPVDLSGWQLRHRKEDRVVAGWLLQDESDEKLIIQPGEYKIVTCYPTQQVGGWHIGFQLEAQGGRLFWLDPRGNFIQYFDRDWPRFPADAALISDKKGMKWGWTSQPTPGAPNPMLETLADIAAEPPAPAATAITLLPAFEGRWSTERIQRALPALLRRKVQP
ncbi:MAG: protein kinase [Prosthecobacter sp.]